MPVVRFALRLSGIALGAVLLALLAGATLARPGTAPDAPGDVTVYVVSNGYHTGVMLPVAALGQSWADLVRSTDLPDPGLAGAWLLFGWGDRAFYLETPTLADVRLNTAAAALFGSGASLVHVDHLDRPGDVDDPRPVQLSAAAYQRLTRRIRAAIVLGPDGRPRAIGGYGDRDVFYEARGAYSAITTCNVWTADTLAAAGVRVGVWTPFAHDVMRWFPTPRR